MTKARIFLIAIGILAAVSAVNILEVSADKGASPEMKSFNYRLPAKKAALEPRTTSRIDLGSYSKEVLETGRIALPLDSISRVVSLVPNEIRTSDFQTYSAQGGKLIPLGKGPCRTYRGIVEGMDGSEVRMYVDENYLGGVIATPTGAFVIDTVKVDRIETNGASARVGTVVISKTDRVSCATCGSTLPEKLAGGVIAKGAGRAPVDPANVPWVPIVNRTIAQKTVKIVTDADFEYVQNQGSASAANARILSFINTYEPFFQQGVGLRLRVSGQVVRDTLPQVYSGQSSIDLLGQLAGDWVNRPTPQRAFVMMLTGKTYMPETDSGVSSSSSCLSNQGFVAREGNPNLFGPFATLNNLSALTTLQMDLSSGVVVGDPDCSSNILDVFIGQVPILGDTLATKFCWKTVNGINQGLGSFSGACIVASAESTVTILNSSSRVVPATGGAVTFSIQGPPSNDWQVYSLDSWMTPQVNYTTGVVTVTVPPIGKGQPTRIGTVVINGARISISQY